MESRFDDLNPDVEIPDVEIPVTLDRNYQMWKIDSMIKNGTLPFKVVNCGLLDEQF